MLTTKLSDLQFDPHILKIDIFLSSMNYPTITEGEFSLFKAALKEQTFKLEPNERLALLRVANYASSLGPLPQNNIINIVVMHQRFKKQFNLDSSESDAKVANSLVTNLPMTFHGAGPPSKRKRQIASGQLSNNSFYIPRKKYSSGSSQPSLISIETDQPEEVGDSVMLDGCTQANQENESTTTTTATTTINPSASIRRGTNSSS